MIMINFNIILGIQLCFSDATIVETISLLYVRVTLLMKFARTVRTHALRKHADFCDDIITRIVRWSPPSHAQIMAEALNIRAIEVNGSTLMLAMMCDGRL